MTFLRFLNPWALVLALSLPLAAWVAMRSLAGVSGFRRALSTALRLAVLGLLVMALAEAVAVRRHDELCVFFVADRSSSIPSQHQHSALQIVNALCQRMGPKDMAGLIIFGAEAAVETAPVRDYPSLRKTSVESSVGRDQTDIGAAMQLALAAFPENCQRRMVVITDGNQTRGDALAQARQARAAGVDVWVLPYRFDYPEEALVEKVIAPSTVKRSEGFDVKVVAESTHAGPATLRLYQDDRLVAEQAVTLTPGKNVFSVRRQIAERGFYAFRAVIESAADTLPQNNEGHAFTIVQGEPRVLVVEGEKGEGRYVAGFLKEENVNVEVGGVEDMPLGVGALQSYDAVVLVNVPAFSMTRNQMRGIEAAVRDFGMGLVMVGGDRAFGAGGYQETPVEQALPVTMEVQQKKVMPNGALALILHTCEIPEGNSWAVQIAKEAVNVLSPYDLVGVLAYDWRSSGDSWVIPMQPVGVKQRMFGMIEQLAPGDMPAFDPCLKLALDQLKTCKASAKHVVIISDGDPSPPTPALVQEVVAAGVSISTVMIAPHGVNDWAVMRSLAESANGRAYDARSPQELPRIFIKEALTVRRSLIFEKRFRPEVASQTEPLAGIPGPLPDLEGYVATTAKDRAQVAVVGDEPNRDPILAQWHYGLGRAAAFTSDAKNRWATAWIGWPLFGKFWTQVVRWTMRTVPSSDLSVSTHVEAGRGRISADAVDARGDYVNFLDLRAEVLSPGLDSATVPLRQTAAGHYEGDFPTNEVGAYLVRVGAFDTREQVSAMQVTGLAVSYSPEYRDLSTNYPLLHAIAREGGGRVMDLRDPVFQRDPGGSEATRDLWWGLTLVALLLFAVDVAVRRLVIDLSPVGRAVGRAFALIAGVLHRRRAAESARDQVMERLQASKAASRATRPAAEPPPIQAPVDEAEATATTPTMPEPEREATPPPPTQEPTPPQPSTDDYTSRLLDAKKRALRGKDTDSTAGPS